MTTLSQQDDPLSLATILEEEAMLLDGRLSKDDSISHRARAGLCFSGGGIRSATFGLGVLQSLARLGLLNKFDYLSTVSGGGYIGSWLTAWIHRHPRGLDGVIDDLRVPPKTDASDRPHPVQWLRNYSNYLSPHMGLFSADSWTLVGIYLRNLLLNWMVLLPLLMLPLLVPRWIIALTQLNRPDALLPTYAIPVLLTAGLGLAVIALIYLHLCRPTLREYRPKTWQCMERQQWFLIACLIPLVAATLCLTMTWAWFRNAGGRIDQFTLHQAVLGGALIHTGSWLFATVALKRFKTFSWWLLSEIVAVVGTGALGGWFLWTVLAKTPDQMAVADYAEWFTCFAVPGVLAMFLLTATMFIGLASRFTEEQDREWWGRTGSWLLIVMVVWSAVSAVVIFGPGIIAWTPKMAASLGGLSGLMTLILGFGSRTTAQNEEERSHLTIITDMAVKAAAPIFMLCVLIALALGSSWQLDVLTHRFDHHLSNPADPDPTRVGKLMPPDPWGHQQVIHNTPLWMLLVFTLLIGFLGFVMARFININRFSLHAMYRNRLIRAYLGASRSQADRERTFNPLTGFDNLDNPVMSDVRFDDVRLARWLYAQEFPPETRAQLDAFHAVSDPTPTQLQAMIDLLTRELTTLRQRGALLQTADRLRVGPACAEKLALLQRSEGKAAEQNAITWFVNLFLNRLHERTPRPLHLINIALNLVRGDNLAWQQRKAQSFTISSLHSGSWNLGYRRTEAYAANHYLDQPLSLGTALAISGAAASPNMGYHSSSTVTFLLALFNIRLGWWLGNPGPAGAETYKQASPTVSVGPLISEAFGLTDARHPYVYLSDGGHFENLGLYEMVLRRCRCILVIDAGCDPHSTFEDLGNAIRKIRIDLGIDIELDVDQLRRRPAMKTSGRHHTIGLIRYDKVDADAAAGTLLYLKASLTGDEPSDVQDYAARHPAFPHEPTSDQFFDEAQFESYRRLGEHVAWEVLGPAIPQGRQDFSALCQALRAHWDPAQPEGHAASPAQPPSAMWSAIEDRHPAGAGTSSQCGAPRGNYSQAGICVPLPSCQCGAQARVTSLMVMFDLMGFNDRLSNFSVRGSIAAASLSVSVLN